MEAPLFPDTHITEPSKTRIFISYKRDAAPDEPVALEICRALMEAGYDVFIDKLMHMGTRWAECIEAEMKKTHYLVVLLSARSVTSQMVKGEIEIANRLNGGSAKQRPVILPIRLAYTEPFQYPLNAYLDPINWAIWRTAADTGDLVREIQDAINGGNLSVSDNVLKQKLLTGGNKGVLVEPLPDAQPTFGTLLPLGSPDEPEDPHSPYYVRRASDKTAERAISFPTATITIKGPEQIGKSSLLFHTLVAAKERSKKIAFLDFQLLSAETLGNRDRFYRVFCSWISTECQIPDKSDMYWELYKNQGNGICSTFYMRDYVLKEIGENVVLVLAIDQIESVFNCEFRDEFFVMLRNWHETRGNFQYPVWKRLNLVFVTSTEPYDLIGDKFISPLNVGKVIELDDFSSEQTLDLNRLYNYTLTEAQVEKICDLLSGHPYLVRRALYLTATEITFDELLETATDDYGPFGDHLRYHLFKLRNRNELVDELKHLIKHKKPNDKVAFHQLRGAGLVRNGFADGKMRCRLYEDFFRRHLDVKD